MRHVVLQYSINSRSDLECSIFVIHAAVPPGRGTAEVVALNKSIDTNPTPILEHPDLSERDPPTYGPQPALVRLVECRGVFRAGAPDLRACMR